MTKPKAGARHHERWNQPQATSDFRPGTVRPNYPPLPKGFRRAELTSIAVSLDLIEQRTSPLLTEAERK